MAGNCGFGALVRTIILIMTSTAGGISFSVGLVAGALEGVFFSSLIRGHFRCEAREGPRELGRQVSGAALMGMGGTVAPGCSAGQGQRNDNAGVLTPPSRVG